MLLMNIITGNLNSILDAHPVFTFIIIVWAIAWKGVALWKAGTLRQKKWFIAILILNTFGLLEIMYLFFVARRYKVEVVEA